MSLKVWLPLNGNLENKGCGNANITSTGTITYMDEGKMGKAVASTYKIKIDSASVQKIFNNNHMSICFWYNNNASKGSSSSHAICGFSGNGEGDSGAVRSWDLFQYSTKNDLHWSMGTLGSGVLSGVFPDDTWVHLAVTYEAGVTKIYINGVLKQTQTGRSSAFDFNTSYYISFGFNQGLNDFRIYDECLTAKQIKEISKGLTLHYTMDRGLGNPNLLRMGGLANNSATSTSYDEKTDTYTIVSPVSDSTWGVGVKIGITNKVVIPYGEYYRISMEVYVPTTHTLAIDYNNYSNDSSVASWNGNDNDLSSARLAGTASIPGGKWTKVVFGSQNAHASNTSKAAIYETSTFGIRTSADTEPVTWYIRHPKVELGTTVSQWCPNSADALYKEMKYDSLIEKDVSGNGYHGTYSKVPVSTFDTPRYSGASYFDNTTYLKGPTLKPEHITISFWTKDSVRFGNWEGGGLGLYYSSGWMIEAYINGGYKQAKETTASTLGTWQMVTGTWDGRYLKIYVNGDLKTTTDVGEYKLGYNATAPWVLNGNPSADGSAVYDSFASHWSDARIYSTALSAEDIKELYNTSAYIDKDGSLRTYALIESGNENLFEGAYTGTGQVSPGAYTRETIDCPESITGTALKVTCTTAGNGFYESGTAWKNARDKMVHGQQYVWSLYCKSDNITSMSFNVECSSAQDRTTFTIGPEYRKLSNVFTYSSETTYSAFTSYTKYVEGNNVYIHSFKVQPYNPNLEIMKTGVYKENDLSEGIENQFTIFKQGTETKEIIEI